jgi:23S rRNA (cytidine2498-2'-O)-methyltransferase
MARWLRRGRARRALFNLKLPMRRRWQAVEDARVRFERVLGEAAPDFSLRIHQLYHDREEVTCYAAPRS